MKYSLLVMISYLISFQVIAKKIESQIHSLDKGAVGQQHLVKLTNGQVAFVEFNDKALLKRIDQSYQHKDWLEFTLDEKNNLLGLQIIPAQFSFEGRAIADPEDPPAPYAPSVVTLSEATSMFRKMRTNYQQDSQCFNRALIWTYEAFINSNINSNKVFLFFTSRYIRSHHYHWWFHVTPMMFIGAVGRANWKILDRRYTHGPINSKTWTDIFIQTKRTCKTVYKYSDYRDHQQEQDCYLIPVSMYYVVPSDIERFEETGEERTSFEEEEVEYARWEAFKTQ
jgi:hypothetical protein